MIHSRNVLRQLYAPTEADYVAAVRKMMLGLAQHHTQKTIAQRIGVNPKTVHNAIEGKCAIEGWVIPRIEWEFGVEATKAIRDLGGGHRDPDIADDLRPHVEALQAILDQRAESRLQAEASRA